MSKLFVDDIVEKTSGHGVVIPGHILQVVNKTDGANQVISGATSTEYTGIATTITPKVTGSKIYVIVNLSLGSNYGGADWYVTRL